MCDSLFRISLRLPPVWRCSNTEEEKKRRNNDLLAIQNAISLEDHKSRVGETVEVLVEGPSKTALKQERTGGQSQLTGRTRSDHIVVFDGNERLVGSTVDVVVENASSFTLFGSVVTEECVGEQGRASPEPPPSSGRTSLPLL